MTVPLFPAQASTAAPKVDALFAALTAVSGFFALGIAAALVGLAVRYRAGAGRRGARIAHPWLLELIWAAVPLGIVAWLFVWGARLFLHLRRPPPGAMELSVVGKQWMWKVQHPAGRLEINSLHVPVGRPVLLRMISADVIHSFFIPAFRVKQDVLPGRYTTLWFEAVRPGSYHLFCAEYCGTAHSHMRGSVVALEPARYEDWLAGGAAETPAERGAALFASAGCVQCHAPGARRRAPELSGLFGSAVPLEGGGSAKADEGYLRESILDPRAKVARGFEPIMPSYAGTLDEDELRALVEHLKSIGAPPSPARGERPAPARTAPPEAPR